MYFRGQQRQSVQQIFNKLISAIAAVPKISALYSMVDLIMPAGGDMRLWPNQKLTSRILHAL